MKIIGNYGVKVILIKDEKTAIARKTRSAIIVMMFFTNLLVISISLSLPIVSAQSIDSRVEPAIVLGSDLGDFIGTSVDEIWVYAFVGGDWDQIPFQLDERNDTTDSYFVDAVDGILDSNDEIVFMPDDAGDFAPETSWVLNTKSQRYEVVVTDPIDVSSKYAYIYSSSSIVQTFTEDYVNYNPTTHVITATDYTIGFDDTKMGIMDEIRVNTSIGGDNTNLLDRMKYRLQITIGIPFLFDEEDFDYTMVGYKDGPVRLVQQIGTGDFVNINYAYKSYAMATQEMNIGTSPDWVRVSLDFLSTSTPMTYYDSNANVLTINGVPDTPASTSPPTWVEVTGSSGTLVIPRDLTQVGGSPSLYYTDDLTSNDAPESESGEHGDSGIYIVNPPTGSPTTFLSFYFLPPNQGNVGSTYDTFTLNPLTTSTQAQYLDSSPLPDITDVSVLPDPQEVDGFVNISANIVDNYEVYGAWIDIIDPNDNPVGNFSMNYDPITGRYYRNRTYDIAGTYQFTIWANDTSNNWNSSFGQFQMQDTILPEISDTTALPYPQEVEGFVNISAIIEDNYELNEVWIDITDPNDVPAGNFSMSYDSGTARYYIDSAYDIVGTYQFTIWANDTSSNWNSSFGQFVMQDTTLSAIIDVTADPDPQEVEGSVNISANIVDNYELFGAWVDITDPNDNPLGNFSMSYNSDTNRYYYEQAYDIVGTYQFTIWARDTNFNWNSSFGQFRIHDTTLPEISDVTAHPDPQEVEGLVDISAILEDNYELNEVWINITDPNDDPVGNFSMSYDNNRYHSEQTFDIVGMYQFTIWANDTSFNWNFSFGQFQMQDTTLPEISNTRAHPDPQEVNGYVKISAVVTDNVDVDRVRIEITDPNDDLVGNFSMSYDLLTNRYNDNRVYDIVGVYQFTIWASDTSDNWESESDFFTIQDTQAPMAHAGLDQAVIEGTTVTFDGSTSTDNVGIVDYTWTFIDGSLQTLYGSSPNYRFNDVGDFKISLSVADAEDNTDTDTMWVNVTIVPDTTLPTITHTPIASITVGEPLLISAEITDDIEVTDASLFYRQSGEAEYTEVAMTNTLDNEWTAEIPSSAITTVGIEYYIFATDGVNDATLPAGDPYFVNVKGEEKGSTDSFWLLLIIILMAVIIVVIILFFLTKTKKEKR
jgi:hypothetical protein